RARPLAGPGPWGTGACPDSPGRTSTACTTSSPSTYGRPMRRSLGISAEEPAELEIVRMRRRHLKGVMSIERQVYPRPWSPNLFLSEMNEPRNRAYLVAKLGRDVAGYRGMM